MGLAVAGCGAVLERDGPPPGGSVTPPATGPALPAPEVRSKYGNGPVYEVWGRRYTVMDSSQGYSERGVASWYGQKFHGRLTASREPYDMYAMTAAHKTLPLPTWVRVKNLSNGKSVVVRVNDRGPFIDNRIIDLSYAAASALDMLESGTSLVEVSSVDFDRPAGDRPTSQGLAAAPPITQSAPPARVFIQVGAFASRDNAERRRGLIENGGIRDTVIVHDSKVEPPLYRVRIGPVSGVAHYDRVVAELARIGVNDPYLVTE